MTPYFGMVLRCWVRLCRVVVGLSLVALLAWPVGGQTVSSWLTVPGGTISERLAATLVREAVRRADYGIDLRADDGNEALPPFVFAARPGLDARVDRAARALADAAYLQTTAHLRMIDAVVPPSRAGVVLEAMELVTSGCTGLWFPEVSAGQRVGAGEPPGAITDSFGNVLGRVVLLGLSSAAR